MGDDEAALVRLWREKRGEVELEDLSGNLIVQLGVVTEPLNRLWYERNTGQAVTDVQRRMRHPVNRWMGATFDGMVAALGAVFEAKFMLPWSFSEEKDTAPTDAVLSGTTWLVSCAPTSGKRSMNTAPMVSIEWDRQRRLCITSVSRCTEAPGCRPSIAPWVRS